MKFSKLGVVIELLTIENDSQAVIRRGIPSGHCEQDNKTVKEIV